MSQSFVHQIESLRKYMKEMHTSKQSLWKYETSKTIWPSVLRWPLWEWWRSLAAYNDFVFSFFLCLCRFHFPIPQTPGHCLQNYILAGLLQQLPQPHHLPLLQSGVQEGLPERSPWPLPQQNTQDLEPSGLCSRPYAWPQICSGFPIYIYWLPEAY